MKLNIFERRTLMDLVPKQEDYAGMKEIRRFMESCSLRREELESVGEVQKDGTYRIDPEKGLGLVKEIPISEWVTTKLQDTLRKMNDDRELSDMTFSLYEKFVVFYGVQ